MNTLGQLFKVTSFGESHGSHVGCIVEGCPAGLLLDLEAIQNQINRRKTNQQAFASNRNENDKLQIISGIFEGKTLGSPIALLIKNEDAQSLDYDKLKNVFRPSHADFTNEMKYGFRDWRGGGRSSIRITAPMVAAGEIAKQLLHHFHAIQTIAFVTQIGNIKMPLHQSEIVNHKMVDASSVRCPNEVTSKEMEMLIEETRIAGDTLGGIVQTQIQNAPIGLGEPIFGKLQAQLAHAMLSINTVKGFEFGAGFENSTIKGSKSNDVFELKNENIITTTNRSGGTQGGISNGELIYFNVAFKPISSIKKTQKTVSIRKEETTINIEGRHDVCAVPRAIPIVEAYANIILIDLLLQNKFSKL
jgi:chorismate synthase